MLELELCMYNQVSDTDIAEPASSRYMHCSKNLPYQLHLYKAGFLKLHMGFGGPSEKNVILH